AYGLRSRELLGDPDAMFPLQALSMSLAEKGLELGSVRVLQLRQLVGFVGPAGFAQEGAGVHWPGDRVQNQAARCAKVPGDVATLLVDLYDLEGGDFMEGRHEMVDEIMTYRG